jgi:hypothetical protein
VGRPSRLLPGLLEVALRSHLYLRQSVAACLLLMSACFAPLFMSGSEVEVVGEFHADGRCDARTERGAISSLSDSIRVSYSFGGSYNVAPAGYVEHVITCEIPPRYRGPADTIGYLAVRLAVPQGRDPQPGIYYVERPPASGQETSLLGVSYRHPAYDPGTKGSGHGIGAGYISLRGTSGVVELLRIDPPGPARGRGTTRVASPRIDARVRIRARREWGM